jgi:hypothetical protein
MEEEKELIKLRRENESLTYHNIELMYLNTYLKRRDGDFKDFMKKYYDMKNKYIRMARENISLWNIIKLYEKRTELLKKIQEELLYMLNDIDNLDDDINEKIAVENTDDIGDENISEVDSDYDIIIDSKFKNMSLEQLLMSFSDKM